MPSALDSSLTGAGGDVLVDAKQAHHPGLLVLKLTPSAPASVVVVEHPIDIPGISERFRHLSLPDRASFIRQIADRSRQVHALAPPLEEPAALAGYFNDNANSLLALAELFDVNRGFVGLLASNYCQSLVESVADAVSMWARAARDAVRRTSVEDRDIELALTVASSLRRTFSGARRHTGSHVPAYMERLASAFSSAGALEALAGAITQTHEAKQRVPRAKELLVALHQAHREALALLTCVREPPAECVETVRQAVAWVNYHLMQGSTEAPPSYESVVDVVDAVLLHASAGASARPAPTTATLLCHVAKMVIVLLTGHAKEQAVAASMDRIMESIIAAVKSLDGPSTTVPAAAPADATTTSANPLFEKCPAALVDKLLILAGQAVYHVSLACPVVRLAFKGEPTAVEVLASTVSRWAEHAVLLRETHKQTLTMLRSAMANEYEPTPPLSMAFMENVSRLEAGYMCAMESSVSNLRDAAARAEEETHELKAKEAQLLQGLVEAEQGKRALEGRLRELGAKARELEKAAQDCERGVKRRQKYLEKVTSDAEHVASARAAAEVQLLRDRAEVRRLDEERALLAAAGAEIRAEVAAAAAAGAEARKAKAQADAELRELEEAARGLEASRASLLERRVSLGEQLRDASGELERAGQEAQQAKDKVAAARTEAKKLQEELARLRGQNKALGDEIRRIRAADVENYRLREEVYSKQQHMVSELGFLMGHLRHVREMAQNIEGVMAHHMQTLIQPPHSMMPSSTAKASPAQPPPGFAAVVNIGNIGNLGSTTTTKC